GAGGEIGGGRRLAISIGNELGTASACRFGECRMLSADCLFMFARKIKIEYEANGQRQPCPLKWLDSFAMRNFTNDAVFDDPLPLVDGLMTIWARVPVDRRSEEIAD